MIDSKSYGLLVGLVVLVWLARPTSAFGAGNIASISKIEGQNWRHGDIEDALLTLTMARAISGKKFNDLQVSRVYFGNWLRDYSQAIDVGTVKSVSAEAIRLLLSVLAFVTFGYGSGEFEVTADRLGCYRPEDHIDNPKNYADNEDATQYDSRLRKPVDEQTELAVDAETGMKNYIANDRAGIMTSSKHVRNLFKRAIELGRDYGRSNNKANKYESLRLMGTGLHCLEDFFAHSNYTELALIELGEREVFPHVGRDTRMRLHGARNEVYPIVTGTFGGVDFLHSVTGELSDKLSQNEIDELEGTLKESQRADTSILRNLLDMIPDGIFGGKHQSDKIDELQANAASSQLQNTQISPRQPEEFTEYANQIFQQIMPVIEFHDEIMKNIERAMGSIPVLPKILEQLEEQLSVFVFSLIAPFIIPIIDQVREELRTGSDEIVQSSEREQHIVFEDDRSTDPTHSMLSKDHFTNILNEIAGRTAATMVHWVVPQLMDAMDNEGTDVDRVLSDIINGIMAHPAQRDMGEGGARKGRQQIFRSVEEWWRDMDEERRREYRNKLSREGVRRGENHKEGVHDTGHGHGCNGKLKMRKKFGKPSNTVEDKIAEAAAGAILTTASGAISNLVQSQTGVSLPEYRQPQRHDEGEGGGRGGGILGMASSLLGGVFGKDETESHSSDRQERDGTYTETQTEHGRHGNRYGEAEQTETTYPDGGRKTEYRRYEEDRGGDRGNRGRGHEQQAETYQSSYGRDYEQRSEQRQESYGGREQRREGYESNSGGGGGGGGGGFGAYGEGGYSDGYGGGGNRDGGYGHTQQRSGNDDDGYTEPRRRDDEYGERRENQYGGDNEYGERRENQYGGDDEYGQRREHQYGGGDEYGQRREHHHHHRGDDDYDERRGHHNHHRGDDDYSERREHHHHGY